MYVHDIVFPVSQPGSCSASCLLSSPAPGNRQESHTVTLLFNQLLLNAGSLKVEHQHTFISYSRSDTGRGIKHNTHNNQWGIMTQRPRVSVCRSGTQHGGQGSHQHLARKDLWSQVGSRAGEVLSPAGQRLHQLMPREVSVAWSTSLVCGAQLSQQWSGVCLSYTLKVVYSTLLGLLINLLAPLMAIGDLPRS